MQMGAQSLWVQPKWKRVQLQHQIYRRISRLTVLGTERSRDVTRTCNLIR